jgi:monoamine oxidase
MEHAIVSAGCVIVVGAGLSGLAAARRLVAAGCEVIVLEARDRVGGRTLSVSLGADRIDLGGQWIGPTQRRVAELARELGVETFRQYTRGRKVMELGGERRTYAGLLPALSLRELFHLGRAMYRADRLARRVDLAHPASFPDSATLDNTTLEQWLARATPSARALAVFRIATQMVFAAEPRELSFLFFLSYLRSGQGLLRLVSADGGAQERRFVGGAQELSLRMAAALGDRVRLGGPVEVISQDDQGVRVTGAGLDERGDHVIVAMSPALADRITFDPPLPAERSELQRSMPMGSVIKCVAAYDRAFWREAGLSGEAISDGWPVRATFDDTSHDGRQPALVAFIIGDGARRAAAVDRGARRAAVLDALARLFGDEARHPSAYVDHDWTSEHWSGGCYAGVLPPGVLTRVGAALRQPCRRVHFAGTETSTRWAGYFDGALLAGERAADEILGSSRAAP